MRHFIRQGTASIIVGCHSPIHSLLVLLAWKKLYGSWPKSWQIVCIFLHDIGHCGKNYLDDPKQKEDHWELGARIAGKLFGLKGYLFVAGHCSSSKHPRTNLYNADKYSWMLAPRWWLYSNLLVEPKINKSPSRREDVDRFQAQVRKNIESGDFRPAHQLHMERGNKKEK